MSAKSRKMRPCNTESINWTFDDANALPLPLPLLRLLLLLAVAVVAAGSCCWL